MKTLTFKKAVCAGAAGALLLAAAGVSAQADKPQPTKYKDWAHICEQPPARAGAEVPKQCYIYQNISVKETNKRLLHFAIGYVGKKGRPAAVVTLPLGIFLPPGLTFGVDKNEAQKFPV